ncbi:minor capsid protein [Allobaculum mucilyticum]|uniref:minor capsid protein n=1 Tax=Allobaculum mucilyticum TaxID=2834459 RepID=UPI001E4FC373|nr:minor capsid protein [Allobaculum mucilyticum]UNT96430.1 minor capsid protein [Allobaculum mucilyticum]
MASSKDYWKQREAYWQKECQKKNVNWQKEIEDVYQTMSDEINDQVAIFYQKYADENGLTMAQAKQYLDQTDIRYYSSLAKRYCEDAERDMQSGTWAHDPAKSYFSKQADEEMKRYNTTMKISRLQMLKRQIDLRIANAQRKVCSVVHDALTDRALQTYTRQAGILGKTVLNNLAHVQTIVQASFHGTNFSNRIWGTHQDKLKKALTKGLQDCLILGKGAAPFARQIRKETGKSIRQAQTLMSTELARVQVQAALDSMQASGFDEFQIISSSDCCDDCQAIDGEHFPLPKLASGTNAPPMHPNCRCSIAPYEARDEDGDDDFDEAAFDEWSDYMEEHEDDPNALTWEEWKKQKTQKEETKPGEPKESGLSGTVGPWGSNVVDKKFIQSPEYRRKFSHLTENSQVNDTIRKFFTGALTKYSGTDTEVMQIIDADTGEILIRKVGNRNELGVSLSPEEIEMIKNYKGNIIGMHNHPTNLLPTGSDFVASGSRKYLFGIVGTHDGRVFKYSHGDTPVIPSIIDKTLENSAHYCKTEDEERNAINKAMERLKADWGLSCEEQLA